MLTFIWPVMLFSLLLVPLFALLYLRLQRRRRRAVANFGSAGLTGASGSRRHLPAALFLAGLAVLLVGLARPQTVVALPKVQGTVILAFDVSGSMAADDFKPTRMEAAKAAARDFVQRQPSSVQVGVVAFSDGGFAVQPPTNDQDLILAAINRLAPQRGTSVGQGILSSLNTIAAVSHPGVPGEQPSGSSPQPTPTPTPVPVGTYTNAVIVLLTDGENNENPDPVAAAQAAASRGVRIYTVGIGTPGGTNLHINGFTVHTQLDEPALQQIAQVTGGTYYNAQSAQDLRTIYDNLSPQLTIEPQKIEVTSLFAGASILVFLVGGVFSLLWFGRLP
ncbi:MAG TPA: VWA domain-containing protein [Anaerolineaceae bacterium]